MTELDLIVEDSLSNGAFRKALDEAVDAYREANGGWKDPLFTAYLAGPMTGIPQFNFPAFDAAALDLRKQGVLILSPAEMDEPEVREMVMRSADGKPTAYTSGGYTRAHFLKRDFLIVLEVDKVIVLPGWDRSSGACDETRNAMALGKPVVTYGNLDQEVAWEQHPYYLGWQMAGRATNGHSRR